MAKSAEAMGEGLVTELPPITGAAAQPAEADPRAISRQLLADVRAARSSPKTARAALEALEKHVGRERGRRRAVVDKHTRQQSLQAHREHLAMAWEAAGLCCADAAKSGERLLARNAARVLATLSGDAEGGPASGESLVPAQVPQALSSVLAAHPGDRIVQREGLRCVVNLSCDKGLRGALAQAGGLAGAVRAMGCPALNDDRFTMEAALAACANLAHAYSTAGKDDEEGQGQGRTTTFGAEAAGAAVDSICAVMAIYPASQSLQTRALQAAANTLAAAPAGSTWRLEEFATTVLLALRSFPETADVQRYGLAALVAAMEVQAEAAPDFRRLLFDRGCLLAVKQAMWHFDVDPIIVASSKRAYELLQDR